MTPAQGRVQQRPSASKAKNEFLWLLSIAHLQLRDMARSCRSRGAVPQRRRVMKSGATPHLKREIQYKTLGPRVLQPRSHNCSLLSCATLTNYGQRVLVEERRELESQSQGSRAALFLFNWEFLRRAGGSLVCPASEGKCTALDEAVTWTEGLRRFHLQPLSQLFIWPPLIGGESSVWGCNARRQIISSDSDISWTAHKRCWRQFESKFGSLTTPQLQSKLMCSCSG